MFEPEKRIPFGFRGNWGRVYKKHTSEERAEIGEQTIRFENNYYVDIGADVQFKQVGDITSSIEQPLKGLAVPVIYSTYETTDAYWNDKVKDYVCCVGEGDVVRVDNRTWIVSSVREVAKFYPNKMSFFYCDMKTIDV